MSYDVSLRLTDGERVPVGSFGDPQKAREYAREVVSHLSDETDGWPFFSGRFMRPETIVSVDIVPVGEPDRWLGSLDAGQLGLAPEPLAPTLYPSTDEEAAPAASFVVSRLCNRLLQGSL